MGDRVVTVDRSASVDRRGLAAANQHRSVYARLVTARVRSDWQYRTSFLTLLLSQAAITGLEALALLIIMTLVPDLGGWSTPEVAFLYGLSAFAFGIADVFVSAVERVANYVQLGTFDRILLRPTPALLQISGLEFELRRLGKVIPPLVLLGWAIPNVNVNWTFGRVAVLVAAICCGVGIYGALWVLAASVSFWAVASREATYSVTYGGQFANEYPLHLYRNWIRATLGWGVPLAFVAYVPTQYLLDSANPLDLPRWLVFVTPAVTLGLSVVAAFAWRTGIRHYQSTGS